MTVQEMSKEKRSAEVFAGKWHNQHNSEIELTIGVEGQLTGVFRTGNTLDGSVELEEFPLTGFVSQDVITFCVRFEEHNSVTAWVGQLSEIPEDENAEILHTLWHMAVDVGNQAARYLWKSTISGADNFVRGPRMDKRRFMSASKSYPSWMESQSSGY